jgi:hypothetical protein
MWILKSRVKTHCSIHIEEADLKVNNRIWLMTILDVGGRSNKESKSERKGVGRMLMMKNRLNNNSTNGVSTT